MKTIDPLTLEKLGCSTHKEKIELLELTDMRERSGMRSYRWHGCELFLSADDKDSASGLFELSSKDIILFKKHPEAISARNLLECTVRTLFSSGRKTGVELDCAGNTLIAEVVQDAVNELEILPGSTVYAAIKASAFRRLSR